MSAAFLPDWKQGWEADGACPAEFHLQNMAQNSKHLRAEPVKVMAAKLLPYL